VELSWDVNKVVASACQTEVSRRAFDPYTSLDIEQSPGNRGSVGYISQKSTVTFICSGSMVISRISPTSTESQPQKSSWHASGLAVLFFHSRLLALLLDKTEHEALPRNLGRTFGFSIYEHGTDGMTPGAQSQALSDGRPNPVVAY
jgi:hypothetical protein